jgi:hypothetical protein
MTGMEFPGFTEKKFCPLQENISANHDSKGYLDKDKLNPDKRITNKYYRIFLLMTPELLSKSTELCV